MLAAVRHSFTLYSLNKAIYIIDRTSFSSQSNFDAFKLRQYFGIMLDITANTITTSILTPLTRYTTVRILIYVCMYVYLYLYMYMYLYLYLSLYIYIFIYILINLLFLSSLYIYINSHEYCTTLPRALAMRL